MFHTLCIFMILVQGWHKLSKSRPVTGLEWPRGFQEVKVPGFHDNGAEWL